MTLEDEMSVPGLSGGGGEGDGEGEGRVLGDACGEPGGDERADRALSEVWRALTADPAVGVSVVDLHGKVLFVNEQSARMFLGKPASEVTGRTLHELFAREWAEERLGVLERIAATGRAVVLRSIRRGVQIQSTITRMETPEGRSMRFLTITHQGEHPVDEPEKFEVIEAQTADLGPLDVLSRRELEVLALIKHGMSVQEMAQVLHRSPKTVEKHRDAISKKLGEASRVRLAVLAQAAGLELEDAGKPRTRDPA